MMIALIVVAVAAVGIIGYMIYNNNQQQAAANAQLEAQKAQTEAAQQEAQQVQMQAQAEAEAQEKAIMDAADSAQTQAVVDANATCEENLAKAQKMLPELEAYSDLLKALGEEIDSNPDEAIEKCRELNEGLSKNECDTKVNNYVDGKTEVYDELQLQIKAAEDVIAAGC